jgi:hypothetical protein
MARSDGTVERIVTPWRAASSRIEAAPSISSLAGSTTVPPAARSGSTSPTKLAEATEVSGRMASPGPGA